MQRATSLVFLIVFLLGIRPAFAQTMGTVKSPEVEQYTQLQRLLTQLEGELENVPFSIQTVATQRLGYDSTRITKQGYQLIKYEIERVFREQARIKVLSLEEFESQKVLHIVGTDSTLSLRNTSKSPNEKENSLRLLELGQKYGIDAFMKGYIQYKYDLGYVVTLELISPTSREVLWNTSLVSKNLDPEKMPGEGKLTLLSAGVSALPVSDYVIQNTSYSGEVRFLDYAFRMALRQPINSKNSGYIGIQGGYHYLSVMPKGSEEPDYQPFNISVFELGAQFYKTLAEKSERENEYWLELFAGPNLLLPVKSQNMFSITQGVNINLSENLGVVVDLQYLLSSDPKIENKDESKNIQLNTIGYGVKILLRL